MALLPNVHKAFVDQEKLKNYCLNFEHPIGKHKAKLFYDKLGITKKDTQFLAEQIYEAVQYTKAMNQHEDQFGKRYAVDIQIKKDELKATLRTAWIVKHGENNPRLLTCYIKTNS